jgi:hypothetical protein
VSPAFDGVPLVACVGAGAAGALALVHRPTGYALLAVEGTHVSEDPTHLLTAARLAGADDAAWCDAAVALTFERLEASIASRDGAATAGLTLSITGTARRLAMRRIAHITAHTPRHRRAVVATLAAEARRVVAAPYGVGAEGVLAELAMSPLPDAAWLRAVRAFGEANVRGAPAANGPGPSTVEALIVFVP